MWGESLGRLVAARGREQPQLEAVKSRRRPGKGVQHVEFQGRNKDCALLCPMLCPGAQRWFAAQSRLKPPCSTCICICEHNPRPAQLKTEGCSRQGLESGAPTEPRRYAEPAVQVREWTNESAQAMPICRVEHPPTLLSSLPSRPSLLALRAGTGTPGPASALGPPVRQHRRWTVALPTPKHGRRPAATTPQAAAAAAAGAALTAETPHLQLATARLPVDVNVEAFASALYQWAVGCGAFGGVACSALEPRALFV